MFEPGEIIIYGTSGACRVVALAPSKDPKEQGRLYYELCPVFRECVIYTPADNKKVFMRPIISREEALSLIDELPELEARAYHNRVLRKLSEHYENIIKSHDCRALAEMLMSLYVKREELEQQKRRFGLVDERYMKRAEELLHGELACALGIGIDEVTEFISARHGNA